LEDINGAYLCFAEESLLKLQLLSMWGKKCSLVILIIECLEKKKEIIGPNAQIAVGAKFIGC